MENYKQTIEKGFSIETKEGVQKRLTVECKVSVDPTLLQEMQTELGGEIEVFSPTTLDNVHLTLGHFGKPDHLFQELKQVVPNLSLDTFTTSLDELLGAVEHVVTENFETTSNEIKLFDSGAVVLTISEGFLQTAKQRVYAITLDFLSKCGVQDPETYLQTCTVDASDLYFLVPERAETHITLGWTKGYTAIASRKVSVPVQISPSFIRNAKRQE